MMRFRNYLFAAICLLPCAKGSALTYETPPHYIQTTASQAALTPQAAIQKLQDGNQRFLEGKMRNRDYALQTKTTAIQGQAPFAVILSCMDSRGSPEIIFDQGIGDIFSLRIAGNVSNSDILGSIEYAIKISNSKIIVVMGHTQCGAVEAACNNVELSNASNLLAKIRVAANAIKKSNTEVCSTELVNAIAKQNVLNVINMITKNSSIVSSFLTQNKISIVGAMHDLSTGKVLFFDNNGQELKIVAPQKSDLITAR